MTSPSSLKNRNHGKIETDGASTNEGKPDICPWSRPINDNIKQSLLDERYPSCQDSGFGASFNSSRCSSSMMSSTRSTDSSDVTSSSMSDSAPSHDDVTRLDIQLKDRLHISSMQTDDGFVSQEFSSSQQDERCLDCVDASPVSVLRHHDIIESDILPHKQPELQTKLPINDDMQDDTTNLFSSFAPVYTPPPKTDKNNYFETSSNNNIFSQSTTPPLPQRTNNFCLPKTELEKLFERPGRDFFEKSTKTPLLFPSVADDYTKTEVSIGSTSSITHSEMSISDSERSLPSTTSENSFPSSTSPVPSSERSVSSTTSDHCSRSPSIHGSTPSVPASSPSVGFPPNTPLSNDPTLYDITHRSHKFGCIPTDLHDHFVSSADQHKAAKARITNTSTRSHLYSNTNSFRSNYETYLNYLNPEKDLTPEIVTLFTQDDEGDNQLMISIILNDEDCSLAIIEKALHPNHLNQVNLLRQSALILATAKNMPNVVRPLIIGGARVDAIDHNGNTPLHIACMKAFVQCAKLITKPFHHTEFKNAKYPTFYQRIPQDLEAPNCDGYACIHLAAQHYLTHQWFDALEIIQILVRRGASINAMEKKSGRTVLHMAAEAGSHELVTFLISLSGLDMDAITYSGKTPAMLARGRGYTNIVRQLKQNGADDSDMDDSDGLASDDENDVEMVNGLE